MRRHELTAFAAAIGTLFASSTLMAQAPLVIGYDTAADYEVASGQFQIDVGIVPSVARRTPLEVFTGNGQDGAYVSSLANETINVSTSLAADVAAGATTIQVGAANLFEVGDLILIVQIQGFSATSGDQTPIVSPGNVGRFELARVQTVAGTNLTLTAALARSFGATGDARSMVVLVPEYASATISAGTRIVPPATWAGASGGVVALAVSGTLTIEGDIDASAAGFRGGPVNPTANADCSVNGLDIDGRGARKGEGIDRRAFVDNARQFGRGNYANGGGGGNPHNAGGGGGSNGGGGGFGGFQWNCGGAGLDPNTRGMPGARIASPLASRLIFGGGGGGGQQNNGNATAGARGGGIVLILASSITGTGRILANGANAANTPGNDGAGGGGAGGTVYTFTRTAPTGTLLFRAAGGNGGDVVTAAAHGPGGGGGGGRVFISAAQGTATVQTPPGNNGTNSTQGGVHGSLPGLLGEDEEGSYVQLAVPATGVDCFRSMTELPAAFHQGELRYLVSRNGGIDWEFWNGLGWVTGARRDNAMDAATLSANIAGFAPNGNFNLRVYLLGDAAFTPAIDTASFAACACGDGTVSPGEGCDDGNNTAGDGCSATCTIEPGWTCTGDPSVCTNACGDGLIGAGEQCDDGGAVSGDGCSDVCAIEPGFACAGQPSVCNPTCGNGTIQGGELCDDGNTNAGDGCSPGCLVEPGYGCVGARSVCSLLCGNGALNGAELCDDGNVLSNDGCSPACLIEPGYSCVGAPSVCTLNCGNGTLQGGEACDDGNIVDGDGCASFCAVEAGWTCVGVPAVCTEDCGDGLVVGAEDCDDGNTATEACAYGQVTCLVCDGSCQEVPGATSFCGDGLRDVLAGEGCDDGNATAGDGCSTACVVEAGWNCAGTPSACAEICGDNLVVGAEDCDDGNTTTEACTYGQNACLVCDATCQQVAGATSFCGDAAIDGGNGEVCDDGDAAAGDGCSATCQVEAGWICNGAPSVCSPVCGDGQRVGGEACDDGNTNAGDGCSAACALELGWICVGTPDLCTEDCGDTLVVGAEDCDDGNNTTEVCVYGQMSCLVCSATCQQVPGATSFCGDGAIDGGNGEACDDGGAAGGDGCSATCQVEAGWICNGAPSVCAPVCGDGQRAGTEACDDGNAAGGDGCSAVCAVENGWTCNGTPSACAETCGDNLVVGAEDCDDGNTTTEACVYGEATCLVCGATCQEVPGATSFCGDAAIDAGNGEVCDDGDATGGDGCSATCQIEGGWSCVGTPSVCSTICGDGQRTGTEACDDGNTGAGDGCSATCVLEPGWTCTGTPDSCTEDCGDGLVVGAEACDDANGSDGDGCSATCTIEPGWSCTGAPSACMTGCGDGVIAGVESCDDGNTSDGDGCSSACTTEPGWTCTGVVCMSICGDGLVVDVEACDDGNLQAGDGCSDLCAIEPGWSCAGAPSTCQTGCGDGVVAGLETCDDGNTLTEACDYGLQSCVVCSASCQTTAGLTSFCGDLEVDLQNGEACDDGNLDEDDGCDEFCLIEPGWECSNGPCAEVCGDGRLVGVEACDDGNTTDGDGCDAQCEIETGWTCGPGPCRSVCGDGMIVGLEACDHGGVLTESCPYGQTSCEVCNEACMFVPGTTSFCGNGLIDTTNGEVCDDGNLESGDGCSATCEEETPSCQGEDCPPTPGCGDGAIDGDEACDDGNQNADDGCSPQCQVESGFDCEGTPSRCEPAETEEPQIGLPPGLDGLPNSAQVAGGGCSCSSEPTPSSPDWPYLGLLALGLLCRGRGRARRGG